MALIKPQFEAGREHVGKGGIVRDAAARQLAVDLVHGVARRRGQLVVCRRRSFTHIGGSGNEEFLLGAHKDG